MAAAPSDGDWGDDAAELGEAFTLQPHRAAAEHESMAAHTDCDSGMNSEVPQNKQMMLRVPGEEILVANLTR